MLGLCCSGGFSLAAVREGYSLLWGAGFSLQWLPLLQIMRLQGVWAEHCGPGTLEHRLSSCGTWA